MKALSQLARECSVYRSTLIRAIDRKKFPASKSGGVWLIDETTSEFKAWLSREGRGRPRGGKQVHTVLENGCEIIRSQGIEVGLMQTEIPGKPEAWLWWCEGQSLVSDQGMSWGTRTKAIMRINAWLEGIGLALNEKEIVRHDQ